MIGIWFASNFCGLQTCFALLAWLVVVAVVIVVASAATVVAFVFPSSVSLLLQKRPKM